MCILLSLFSQISTWLFINYVESPHMTRVYGNQIRPKSGVESAIKKEMGKLINNDEFLNVLSTSNLRNMIRKWESKDSDVNRRRRASRVSPALSSDAESMSDHHTDEDTSRQTTPSPKPAPGLRHRSGNSRARSFSDRIGEFVKGR